MKTSNKIKAFGTLTIKGTLDSTDAVEVWGAVVINGYL